MVLKKKEPVEKPIEVALWDAANKLRGRLRRKVKLRHIVQF